MDAADLDTLLHRLTVDDPNDPDNQEDQEDPESVW
jgi:hypothetical protein